MKNIISALTGPSGTISSRRVQMLLCSVAILSVWAYVSVKKVELQPLSEWQVALVLGSGALVAYHPKKENEKSSS